MTALDFTTRSDDDELMDTETVDFEEFRGCLVDLARVNRMTFAYRPTLAFFDHLLPRLRGLNRPLQVVDVGSGYGDMSRKVEAWARHNEIPVKLTGVDLNPWSARAATEATQIPDAFDPDVFEWVTDDVFSFAPREGIDVVMSSLFTHHLPDPLVARFLAWMDEHARIGWIVNDLHRHPVPYHVFSRFARLARMHRFVQHDGPVSIARAFTAADWARLLKAAGIGHGRAEVQWWMPFRIAVTREKP